MKPLKIDFDEIQKAMEDTARDAFDYFLDLETGEILILSEDIINKARAILEESYDDDIGDFEEIEIEELPVIPEWMEDEIELAVDIFIGEKERYIRIPERSPKYAYRTMRAFVETIAEEKLNKDLVELLEGKNSFRRFKDALAPHPKERKLWYRFNATASREEIRSWLESLGIAQEKAG